MQFHTWLEAVRARILKSRSRRRPDHRKSTELLEQRTLLSVSSLVVGTELSIVADSDDTIAVRPNPLDLNMLQVVENGVATTTVDGVRVTDITSIDIRGGSGNNVIDVQAVEAGIFQNLQSIHINAGDGHDTIRSSLDIDTTVDGSDGNDSITGGGGDDLLDAGDGNDTITAGGGDDTVIGGDGHDLVMSQGGNDSVTGGDGDDTLSGGGGDDTMRAGDGMDIANGNGGDDSIEGSSGDDLVQGDAGNDTVLGGIGTDTVGGGDGDDDLHGDDPLSQRRFHGNDQITGGDGDDSIRGGDGDDTIDAEDGADFIDAGLGRDTVNAGAGNDRAFGGSGRDLVRGEDGIDSIFGNSGNDTLEGGSGADVINGGNHHDEIRADDTSVLPPTQQQLERLFAVPTDLTNSIVEIDPVTGQEILRFLAPEPVSAGPDGLAYDGNRLFFLNGSGTDMLYEIDIATGLVVDADPISAGTQNYDGLAVLGGLIYMLDVTAFDIHVFDPSTDTIVQTLDINAANAVVSQLSGGLSAIADPDRLVVTEAGGNRVLEIDPSSGTIASAFVPNSPSAGSYLGAAVLGGEIYLGSGSGQGIDVFSRSGLLQRSITLPYGVSALGGDDLGTQPVAPATAPTGQFDIVFNLLGNFTPQQQAQFQSAANRWEEIIVGDVPDVFVPGIGNVDDIVINVQATLQDGLGGTLAESGLIAARTGTFLPSAAFIEIDSADIASLENSGFLETVMRHEIGHALGFGTIWELRGLISGATGNNPRYTGAAATQEYNLRFGLNDTSVPVENTGGPGTADVHWRETVFGNELMTGFLNPGQNPITRLTIAQFVDLGYQVDFSKAEPDSTLTTSFTALNGLANARGRDASGPTGQFLSIGSAGNGSTGGSTATQYTVDQLRAQLDANSSFSGVTKVVDQQPMLVAPGLDPGKFNPQTPLGKQLLSELNLRNPTVLDLAGLTIPESGPNDTLSQALNLDNSGFSLQFNDNVGDATSNTSTTIPYILIDGTGDDTYDYYSFTVTNAGDRGIFDIDNGADAGIGMVDTQLFLFDGNGNLIASNDDPVTMSPAVGAGGSTSSLDSFFEFTFATPGLYVIGVGTNQATASDGGINPGGELPTGATYTLAVSVENHATGVITTPQGPPAIPSIPGDTVDGGDGNDTITGSAFDDLINANRGNDSVDAGDGQDTIFGAAGHDTLNGGGGNDFLRGHSGNDETDGGDGADIYSWRNGDGNDTIRDSEGADVANLDGTNGTDVFSIAGSRGVLTVGLGPHTVSIEDGSTIVNVNGRGGFDQYNIGDINDITELILNLNAADGDDTISGGGANADGTLRIVLDGGDGDDVIVGTRGNDELRGGAGNDVITGGAGNDTLDGGSGLDLLNGEDGDDSLSGGFGSDTLNGGNGDDVLDGGRNNDFLRGFDGSDTLEGGSGDDTADGGSGNDSLSGSSGDDSLQGGDGDDFLNGGTDEDTLEAGEGDDTVRGGDGHDVVMAGEGDDIVDAGDGDDTIRGGDGDDVLNGGDGNDSIIGDLGDDVITGMDGTDTLLGAGGSDIVLGGDGTDFINGGGSTNDTVAGGEGTTFFAGNVMNAEINESFVLSDALLALLQALPPDDLS